MPNSHFNWKIRKPVTYINKWTWITYKFRDILHLYKGQQVNIWDCKTAMKNKM